MSIKNVTIDSGNTTVYSNLIVLGSNKELAFFGLRAVGDAAFTVELQTPIILGDEEPDSDVGWKVLTASHGWDGFPDGDPAGADYGDVTNLANAGPRVLRFKLTWASGTSVVDLDVNIKSNY